MPEAVSDPKQDIAALTNAFEVFSEASVQLEPSSAPVALLRT